MTFITLKI